MIIRLALVFNLMLSVAATGAKMAAQTPTPACKSTVTGTLEVISLKSKVYGSKRILRVWLPTGYSTQPSATKRYPVLYLFDGQMLFDRCTSQPFPDEWHVDETLTALIAKKTVEPLIAVGIDNAGPGHREEEYARYGPMADAPQKLAAFMTIEVLPLIDGRYRTLSDRTQGRGWGFTGLISRFNSAAGSARYLWFGLARKHVTADWEWQSATGNLFDSARTVAGVHRSWSG